MPILAAQRRHADCVRKFRIAAALFALASACGSEGSGDSSASTTTALDRPSIRGVANPATCEGVLSDPFFMGEGETGLSGSSNGRLSCTLTFRGSSEVLPKLGIDCPPQGSVLVAVDVETEAETWTYDPVETAALDNASCALD